MRLSIYWAQLSVLVLTAATCYPQADNRSNLGMNLWFHTDYNNSFAFTDIVRRARSWGSVARPDLSTGVRVDQLGWDMDGYRQFLRLFANPDKREEAAITYVEQNQLGFHFASVTSRGSDGAVFTTWNCPVSSSLKTPPMIHLNRVGEGTFQSLTAGHVVFLEEAGRSRESLQPVDPETVRAAVERDMESQMQHNLREGLLYPADEGHGRYSWRGMLYLWGQFLRDVFRFS